MTSERPSLFRQALYSPGEDRLRAGWRLLMQLLLMLACLAALAFPLTFFPAGGFLSNFLIQLLSVLGITLSVFLARRYFDHRPFRTLGLERDRHLALDILAGIVIMGAVMGLLYALESGLGWVQFQGFTWENGSGRTAGSVILEVVPAAVSLFIMVAWQEELLMRGYILRNLTEGLNLLWGVLLSSIFFALFHLSNPNASWVAIVGLTLAGVFFAYAYLRTRRLWLPIGLHLGWNLFEGPVFGFPVSGLTFPTILRQAETGPDLWTGGPFGPEAGLVVLPALLLAAGLVWLYTRERGGDRG